MNCDSCAAGSAPRRNVRRATWECVVAVAVMAGGAVVPLPVAAAFLEEVSVGHEELGGEGVPIIPLLSRDGTRVIYHTGDNYLWFERDLTTSTTTLLANPLPPAAGSQFYPAITPDGRSMAFSAADGALVPGDTNDMFDLFVYDSVAMTYELISVANNGARTERCSDYGFSGSVAPSISDDGRFVVFYSYADNLPGGAPGESPNCHDVFLRDRCSSYGTAVPSCTPTTSLIETGPGGVLPAGLCITSSYQAISADGRFVVFACYTLNSAAYAPGVSCTEGICSGVYRADRCLSDGVPVPSCSPATTLVSLNMGGGFPLVGEGLGLLSSYGVTSPDGSRIPFAHSGNDIVASDFDLDFDVYMHDPAGPTTTRISDDGMFNYSVSYVSLSASDDGRRVVFSLSQPTPEDFRVVLWADCPAIGPVCGDGYREPGCERCDDGNLVDGDGCDSNCTPTACGNGIATAGEVCDDGDLDDGDGCDSNCTPTSCGNDIVTTGEACDDGNLTAGDGCSAGCSVEADELTPAGGSGADCFHEWLPNPQPEKNGAGIPKSKLECTDDDPSCDFGPPGDNACTFKVALCFNVTDPRLPACTPGSIASVTIKSPKRREPPVDPIAEANRDALDGLIASLGGEFGGSCTAPEVAVGDGCLENEDCDDEGGDGRCSKPAWQFSTPLAAPLTCTHPARFTVPLKLKAGEYKSARGNLKLIAALADASGDADKMVLKCNPAP